MRSRRSSPTGRWVISTSVRPAVNSSRVFIRSCSLARSRPSVGSSSNHMGASRRTAWATARRRASPPERPWPDSPIQVSKPWGRAATKASSRAARRADHIWLSSAAGQARRRLSRIVALKRWDCWETTARFPRRWLSLRARRSRPPMRIWPFSGSQKRTSSCIRVDLPAPVAPMTATRSPWSMARQNSFSTAGSPGA